MKSSSPRNFQLAFLLSGLPAHLIISIGDRLSESDTVTGLSFDSRRVVHGDIFFALTGGEKDGHDYIP
ncbi:MAG: hypothetical protein ACWGQW_26295, partial [bacterium]